MVDFYSSGPEPANFQAIRVLGFAAIGATFSKVGVPTNNTGEIIGLINDTDAVLIGSVDGVTDQFYIPAKSGQVFDLFTNRKVTRIITQFYVRHYGVAPTTGNFAVEVLQ